MLHKDCGDLCAGRAGKLLELGEGEIELQVAWESGLRYLGRGFAAGRAVERCGRTGLPGRRREAGAPAGEVDGYEDGALTRCTTAPSPDGNGLGNC